MKCPVHRAFSPMMVGSGVLQQFSHFLQKAKENLFFFWRSAYLFVSLPSVAANDGLGGGRQHDIVEY